MPNQKYSNSKIEKLGITRQFYTWDELPLLINLTEACTLLCLSEETVRKLCKNGSLPAVKFNGSWRIDKIKLQAMFETKS